MKILIVSDTHRYLGNLQTALEEEGQVDMLIHLGDIEHQMADVIQMAGCPVHMIAGNNDFLCNLPEEEEFEIGSYHVWITHGHRYGVSFDTEEIKEEIRRLVKEEDKKKPLSDSKIVSLLEQKNMKISRRTVAKYRAQLGIAGTTQRKIHE